jgi:hypothetical protein
MTPTDITLTVFTACNSLRVIAYLPQILQVGRDANGATAISRTTWALFAASHQSTVAYAMVVADDWRMAAVFGANTACCLAILGLTTYKRTRHIRDSHRQSSCPDVSQPPTRPGTPPNEYSPPITRSRGEPSYVPFCLFDDTVDYRIPGASRSGAGRR